MILGEIESGMNRVWIWSKLLNECFEFSNNKNVFILTSLQ